MNADEDFLPLSRRALHGLPATTLDDAVKVCDPSLPLDPEADEALRVDLDAIRGGDRLATWVRDIRRKGSSASMDFLTGHVGAGKTTELLRMRRRLGQLPQDHRPTVLTLDATPLVDVSDVDLEDVLVALWRLVLDLDKLAASKVLTELWKSELRDAIVAQGTGASALLRGVVDRLPSVATDGLTRLLDVLKLQPPEQRKELRGLLGNLTDTLLRGLNKALEALRQEVAGPVVLLIDNLEKLNIQQRERVEHLYVERFRALSRLEAHLVITAPSFLVYSSSGASLFGQYGSEVLSLPMIRIHRPEGPADAIDPEGLALMTRILTQRVDFAKLFVDGHGAAEALALASGGCIRHALSMVVSAINQQDDPPITRISVERAVAIFQSGFLKALDDGWIPVLKEVHASKRFPTTCAASMRQEMLRHLFVLEYQLDLSDTWFDVHPLVVRSRRFREAK